MAYEKQVRDYIFFKLSGILEKCFFFQKYYRCDNSQSCTLSATTSEMGDPCPYTIKYLETYYRCVKGINEINLHNI